MPDTLVMEFYMPKIITTIKKKDSPVTIGNLDTIKIICKAPTDDQK
jgi:hypothetical protein